MTQQLLHHNKSDFIKTSSDKSKIRNLISEIKQMTPLKLRQTNPKSKFLNPKFYLFSYFKNIFQYK